MAVKGIFIVHRRQGMSREAFGDYWKVTHGPIAAKIPGLRKHVQNHIVPARPRVNPLATA